MQRVFRGLALLLVATVVVTGCETADPAKSFPKLTFQHLKPIGLDVSGVEVVRAYQPPLRIPNVDHRFDTPPVDALEDWAKSRFKAAGAGKIARLTITDASVVHKDLKLDKSFTGTFKREQSDRYDLSLDATLEILGPGGVQEGHMTTRVTRSTTAREDATLNDIRQIWFDLLEQAMADFDAQAERNTRQFLATWIRS